MIEANIQPETGNEGNVTTTPTLQPEGNPEASLSALVKEINTPGHLAAEEEGGENQENEEQEQEPEQNQGEDINQKFAKMEKMWKDSQEMIGRQANELGQLRKEREETKQAPEVPYYDVILGADDTELVAAFKAKLGDEVDPGVLRDKIKDWKFMIKMAKDMVQDAIKPISGTYEDIQKQKAYASKEQEFVKAHPELTKREGKMREIITQSFPNGIPQGIDPFVLAHSAYEAAGLLLASAKSVEANANSKNIVGRRAINGPTSNGAKPLTPNKKTTPMADMVNRAIEKSLGG